MSELKPCPFCGAGTFQIRPNGRMWLGMKYSEPASVSVLHWCEAMPGHQPSRVIERVGRDEASAIEAWNRRAQPAQANNLLVKRDEWNALSPEARQMLNTVARAHLKSSTQNPVEVGTTGKVETVTYWQRGATLPAQAGQVLTLDEVRESVHEAGLDWHNGWTMGEDAENRYLNLCRAIEQVVLAKRVPQWLPIETAPEPEVNALGEASMVIVHWKRETRDWSLPVIDVSNTVYLNRHKHQATHWMPLPQPPGIVGEKGGA